jgi:hypothetical protein
LHLFALIRRCNFITPSITPKIHLIVAPATSLATHLPPRGYPWTPGHILRIPSPRWPHHLRILQSPPMVPATIPNSLNCLAGKSENPDRLTRHPSLPPSLPPASHKPPPSQKPFSPPIFTTTQRSRHFPIRSYSQVLPKFQQSIYMSYKTDTSSLATWLLETASECCYQPHSLTANVLSSTEQRNKFKGPVAQQLLYPDSIRFRNLVCPSFVFSLIPSLLF